MSRRNGVLDFSGGMNNVTPAHMLKDNEAEQIRNLYLDADGVWKDINSQEEMLDLSGTHLSGAVKVIQWKPTKVPSDCVDDFVYVVFTHDGVAKLVYRGEAELQVYSIGIKARVHGTNSYRSVSITGVTPDLDGNANGATSTFAYASLTRRYNQDTAVSMTAASQANANEGFLHWWDDDASAVLSTSATLQHIITDAGLFIAEYVPTPYIKITDSTGMPITSLGEFEAEEYEYSEVKSYYVGGVSLTHSIKIYPPELFEVSLNGTTWATTGSFIEIPVETANSGLTRVFVRYFGVPEE